MNIMEITSLDAANYIREFAAKAGLDFLESGDEQLIKIPDTFGEGTFRGINLSDGMVMNIFEGKFNEDTEIHMLKAGKNPLKFIYCLEESFSHRFDEATENHELQTYQSSIVSLREDQRYVMAFSKNRQYRNISLNIDRNKFNSRFQCYLGKTHPDVKKIFCGNFETPFYYQGPLSIEVKNLFQKIELDSLKFFTKRLYMEAFVHHLIVIQLLQYEDDQRDEDEKALLRGVEEEAIRKAAFIIQEEMENLGTIQDLSRRVGLNQNKLQNGFQLLLNCTVNEYLQKQRLKKAVYLLENTNLNMNEICDRLGLNSPGYFSRIFKEAYGYSPSDYRNI